MSALPGERLHVPHQHRPDTGVPRGAKHEELLHLGAMAAVGPRAGRQLDRADDTAGALADENDASAGVNGRGHVIPVLLVFGARMRQHVAHRCATVDGVGEERDQLVASRAKLRRAARARTPSPRPSSATGRLLSDLPARLALRAPGGIAVARSARERRQIDARELARKRRRPRPRACPCV